MLSYEFATSFHVSHLVELRIEFLTLIDGAPLDREGLAGALRAYFAENLATGEHVAAIALDGQRIVGVAGLVYHRYPPSGDNFSGLRGHILNVYTVESYRRRGIGTRLMEMLIEYARSHGCQRVTLHAVAEARGLYVRLGFRAVDSEMRLEF
jgi:GNAT superfamily N-acetyltransferase